MIKPLRFCYQPILPLTYDQSLSYMELLCKVVDKLNEVIDTVSGQITPELIERINTIFADVTYNESTHTISFNLEVE